jgi:hypothetical protein
LITLLLEAKEERQLLRLRQQLGKLDLLILDELGYVPASKAGAELLFDVIASAYERNSLIVTTKTGTRQALQGSERSARAEFDHRQCEATGWGKRSRSVLSKIRYGFWSLAQSS